MPRCPYCRSEATDARAEIQHMQAEHPDIVERAYLAAGFTRDPTGHWVDARRLDSANAVRIAARRFPPVRNGVLHRGGMNS